MRPLRCRRAVATWLGCLALGACEPTAPPSPDYQGIVELEERLLAFEVGGRLLSVEVRRGDVIEKGTPLAHLDDTLSVLSLEALQAQARATKAELSLLYAGTRREEIEQARARASAAEATLRTRRHDLERAQALLESGATSEDLVDQARLRLEQAEAARAEAREQLKALRRGPREQEIEAGEARLQAALASANSAKERIRRHDLIADGRAEVLDVPVHFGEYVSPGTTVVTVADTAQPYVEVFVPQPDVSKIRVGAPVTVRVDSLDVALGGRVEHVARSLEYSPRFLFSPRERPYLVLRARVRILDAKRELHAGIPAFVELGAPPGAALPPAPTRRQPPAADSGPASPSPGQP